ncbi:diguanylate cyclase [Shewanella sairae]|uniref:Diguanylate cyclase n=1 Tax=Shewanella sairae TaxID=190310 RepID=A0ABQ4PK91_9GAMM|nr:sensor domain-containing diguanylate cyclase [Shewanella sairae]MCL1131661.1 sensor domain-containing diguanylate cyclase [Shewanella sairae]GIU48295.1 diguanylate cyclase [Shewanella sairae]
MDKDNKSLVKLNALVAKLQQSNAQLEQENLRLNQEKKLLEQKLNAALDGTGLCLWEQHIPSGNLTMFNMEWGSLLGYTIDEMAAHVDSWKGNLHPDDRQWVIANFEDHVSGKTDSYDVTHRMVHKDGTVSWVSDRGRVIEFGDNGEPIRIMGTHVDITKEKRYELELAKLAHRDPLTDLLNRKALLEAFELQRKQVNAGALMFIDLDDFKSNNDRYGHKFGDSVLIKIAETLQLKVPESNAIARIGGDEFVILLESADPVKLSLIADRILTAFGLSLVIENKTIQIGMSIGISLFTTQSFAEICEQADHAMYEVKRQGKNSYLFHQ